VLCEKPFTANAEEAASVEQAAQRSNLVVMEAFHYRYHELARRMRAVVTDGRLGDITRVQTWMCFPLPKFSDIRYSRELAGGSLMDACYAAHCLRLLGPAGEPTVISARAVEQGADVDRAMTADVRWDGGATGRLHTSMWSRRLLRMSAQVEGTRGSLRVFNFVAPQYFNRMRVTVDGVTTRSRVRGEASYVAQLRAFAAAVSGEETNLTPPSDAVLTMRLIDDCYRAAGLTVLRLPSRDDRAVADSLRLVHRRVGDLHQVVRGDVQRGRDGQPEACLRRHPADTQTDLLMHRGGQPSRDRLDGLRIDSRKQDEELVTAEPADDSTVANAGSQAGADDRQELVAHVVAVVVVDGFERVEVDEQHGRWSAAGRGCLLEHLLQERDNAHPVVAPGERVEAGAVFQLLL